MGHHADESHQNAPTVPAISPGLGLGFSVLALILASLVVMPWQLPNIPKHASEKLTVSHSSLSQAHPQVKSSRGEPCPTASAAQADDDVCVFFSVAQSGSEHLTQMTRAESQPHNAHTTNQQRLEQAVLTLLAGPSAAEKARGAVSEIPSDTRLLGIRENRQGGYTINLSQAFVEGGGANSVMNRIGQLAQTVKHVEGKKPIYLNIEGERLKAVGGEGLEVSQPINWSGS